MRWYNPVSDGETPNLWPATGVDVRNNEPARLVSLADLGGIITRVRHGDSTLADRLALIELADEIDRDAPATELVGLADVLRQMAGA